MHRLNYFTGRKVNAFLPGIKKMAAGYAVLIKGHDAPANIDNENRRLNVYTDKDGIITHFTIG